MALAEVVGRVIGARPTRLVVAPGQLPKQLALVRVECEDLKPLLTTTSMRPNSSHVASRKSLRASLSRIMGRDDVRSAAMARDVVGELFDNKFLTRDDVFD